MLIPFPSFESFLALTLSIAHLLHDGQHLIAGRSLDSIDARLRRIRSSRRHRRLAEFVGRAVCAFKQGGYEQAIPVLLAAVEFFANEAHDPSPCV
jgi:hypothetical protein